MLFRSALETLSLGILGKRALWRVLRQIPANLNLDFDGLIQRAEDQFERVERMRRTIEVQHDQLDAASRRPRDRDELARRMRDGSY